MSYELPPELKVNSEALLREAKRRGAKKVKRRRAVGASVGSLVLMLAIVVSMNLFTSSKRSAQVVATEPLGGAVASEMIGHEGSRRSSPSVTSSDASITTPSTQPKVARPVTPAADGETRDTGSTAARQPIGDIPTRSSSSTVLRPAQAASAPAASIDVSLSPVLSVYSGREFAILLKYESSNFQRLRCLQVDFGDGEVVSEPCPASPCVVSGVEPMGDAGVIESIQRHTYAADGEFTIRAVLKQPCGSEVAGSALTVKVSKLNSRPSTDGQASFIAAVLSKVLGASEPASIVMSDLISYDEGLSLPYQLSAADRSEISLSVAREVRFSGVYEPKEALVYVGISALRITPPSASLKIQFFCEGYAYCGKTISATGTIEPNGWGISTQG